MNTKNYMSEAVLGSQFWTADVIGGLQVEHVVSTRQFPTLTNTRHV